jgi:microsomal dipeptidase-like Zn-dependent dipeptidase
MPYVSDIVPKRTVYNTLGVDYDKKSNTSDTMETEQDWEKRVSNLLKAELKRKGVTYAGLVEKLAAIGVDEKEANIKNKLSRGKFSAVFLFQCLHAIKTENLHIT